MKRRTFEALIEYLDRDPKGFASALINTIDTHAEEPTDETGGRMQDTREEWALEFLLRHDNHERSDLED